MIYDLFLQRNLDGIHVFITYIRLHRAFFSQLKHNIQLVMVSVQQLKVLIKCFIILLVLTLLYIVFIRMSRSNIHHVFSINLWCYDPGIYGNLSLALCLTKS